MLTDVDIRNLPEMLKKMMKSEKFNPQQLMQMVAPMMQGTCNIFREVMHGKRIFMIFLQKTTA